MVTPEGLLTTIATVVALTATLSMVVIGAETTMMGKEYEEDEVKGVVFPYSKQKGILLGSENKFFL